MQTIATNIRFLEDEYRQLKALAFSEGKSIARLIRESVKLYKDRAASSPRMRQDLIRLMAKSRTKIDVSTSELVSDGRRV